MIYLNKRALLIPIVAFIILLTIILSFLSFASWYPCQKADKLISLIEKKDFESVKKMLDNGTDPNVANTPTSNFWYYFLLGFAELTPRYPLDVACENGNLEMVELLISYGADTVETNKSDSKIWYTLLRHNKDDLEILKLLISSGSDVNERRNEFLFMVADNYPVYYEDQVINASKYDSEAAREITDIVKLLINGGSANVTNTAGKTLLMCAAARGNIDLADFLMYEGVNTLVKDQSGKTAYDYAMERGHIEIAEMLKP